MAVSLLPRVLSILGPTAIGKTAVAIALAERLSGEIVSCDSRQVFKHLDIGTAKPTEAERNRARFHLIDIVPPNHFMNAYEFRKAAEVSIDDIVRRNKTPIMTVGTGFYFHAMTRGIFEAPPADDDFRDRMERIAATDGPLALHARLTEIDPETASAVPANDKVRVIRALELYHLTGKTRSELSSETQLPPSPYQFVSVQLVLDRQRLYERIDRRCERMLTDGLVEEARFLKTNGLLSMEMAQKIVGYKEAYDYLDSRIDRDEMLAQFQKSTRNYAKRQLTWFRQHESGRQHAAQSNMLLDHILRDFNSV